MRCKTSERHDSNNTTRKDRHEVLTMKTTTRDNKQTHGVLGALKNKKKRGGHGHDWNGQKRKISCYNVKCLWNARTCSSNNLISLCFVIMWKLFGLTNKLLMLLHDNIFLTLQQHPSESHGYKCCNYYVEKKTQGLIWPPSPLVRSRQRVRLAVYGIPLV